MIWYYLKDPRVQCFVGHKAEQLWTSKYALLFASKSLCFDVEKAHSIDCKGFVAHIWTILYASFHRIFAKMKANMFAHDTMIIFVLIFRISEGFPLVVRAEFSDNSAGIQHRIYLAENTLWLNVKCVCSLEQIKPIPSDPTSFLIGLEKIAKWRTIDFSFQHSSFQINFSKCPHILLVARLVMYRPCFSGFIVLLIKLINQNSRCFVKLFMARIKFQSPLR